MFYYLDKVTGTFGDEADLMIFFIDSTPATADELAEMGDTERLKFVLQNVPRKKQIHNGLRSLASENQGLNYENQNLNSEIAELHQRVTRLSDLYKLVCEENKELLEELNADKPLEQETKKQKE